ncbi:hypothetical protein TBLA_0A08500 [Henningerozyma blattae CBS 6284]|uniref:Uncharacterized protein n=1 Tax=Henningerozyma blattae (strain ATCC 34711 / CBS 6284 / DSM 70876 / NBRC 10599 / NRRL Y-10934 / UCD 77-7) TaxID=1071380 RepID=I2GWY7_HENB6|nr:hypothetical protein TBLA_0A08500 [Tetrapisispora blattae CBS 6284]CCH58639.1 hypothetical protein TBLA_0A08500 [Tetrapisispora blattae CBS 6284]
MDEKQLRQQEMLLQNGLNPNFDGNDSNFTDSPRNIADNLYKQRNRKFKKLHILYVFFIFSIAILQFISIAFFSRGFLLTRNVLDNISTDNNPNSILNDKPQFDKTVILIVDALRFNFVIPVDVDSMDYNPNYHNNIDVLYDTFKNSQDSSSVLLKFIADPPTTTMQRLKGLTTGTLPTFIDAGSNFDGSVILEDNLIKQLYLNKFWNDIYFVGDDTWDALFKPYLNQQFSRPFDSLNVWDLDTVDNGVISYFHEYLIDQSSKDQMTYKTLIGHMLGVDHVGHKYGPNHFTMKEKQLQINQFLKEIINSIDDNTLLVVMGDHGMDHTGNHGGDSVDELESTLFMYAKKKNSFTLDKDYETSYNISNFGESYKQVNQIDLVPTLSLLLDLQIPFNSLGWPIDEIAQNSQQLEMFQNITVQQLHTFKETSNLLTSDDERNLLLDELFEKNLYHDYQIQLLEVCKDLWARFDYISIAIGITFLFISLVYLIILTQLIPSIVINKLVTEFVPLIICLIFILNLIFFGTFYVFPTSASQHHPLRFLNGHFIWTSLFSTAIGIILGIMIPLLDHYSIKWLICRFFEFFGDYWTRVAGIFVILHSLLFASNSFTIWEDKIVGFFLTSFGCLTLYEFVFVPKRQSTVALLSGLYVENKKKVITNTDELDDVAAELNKKMEDPYPDSLPLSKESRILGSYHSILLIILTRLVSTITICREEQGDFCKPTFTIDNNYSPYIMGLLFIMIFLIPSLVKGYFRLSSSYQGAAPFWINGFLRCFLLMNFIYWFITSLEITVPSWSVNLFKGMDIKTMNFTLSRTLAGFSLVAANIGWLMGPLCIELGLSNNSENVNVKQASVLGYKNIYGSQFFLLVINVFMSIVVFNKPLAQLSIFAMLLQLLTILEIIDLFRLKQNIIGPVALGLLCYQQYFTTGHQATIPSIQWDMGFILSPSITFPLTHIGLFLNTFGPHIIVSLSVALLTFWRQPPSILNPQTLLARIVSSCGGLAIYNTVLCLSSFIFVTHFRRHLMVWKIFCPRYLFASASLLITQFIVVFVTIAFASGRLIRQINELFWRQ